MLTTPSYVLAALGSDKVSEKVAELIQYTGFHPTTDLAPTPLRGYEAGMVQLLDVVGDSGRRDVQVGGQLADTSPGHFTLNTSRPWHTTTGQAPEDLQPIRVPECLESVSQRPHLITSIIRHISK